ncbi:MAG: peptidyl-arginine deiminase, partial [Nitrospirae bacterium CG17_big_fil_post_rev_8_21_14_2_50_50_9]
MKNDSINTEQRDQKVTIGLVQSAVSGDASANMERASEKIREAASRGAQIISLPELYRSRYFPQEEKGEAAHLAESIPGESTKTFSPLAKKLGVVIILPLFEKAPDGRFYNSAVVIDADGK